MVLPFFVYPGTRQGYMNEKGDRREEFAQFGQRPGNVVLHGLGADVERLGNVVVGHVLVTAHAENPPPLLGHIADGQVYHLQQVARRDVFVGFGHGGTLRSPGLRLIFVLHLPVFISVEDGVSRHAEQIATKRKDVPERPALLPDLQENIVRKILGISLILEQPKSEIADLGGIAQVEDIQCFGVPVTEFFQDDMFVAIHSRSLQI